MQCCPANRAQIFVFFNSFFAGWCDHLGLHSAILPLVAASLLAYLTFPCIIWAESFNVPRGISAALLLIAIILLLFILAALGLPYLGHALDFIANNLPKFTQYIVEKINLLLKTAFEYQITIPKEWQQLLTQLNWQKIDLPHMSRAINHGMSALLQLTLNLFYWLLFPVFTIILLRIQPNSKLFL